MKQFKNIFYGGIVGAAILLIGDFYASYFVARSVTGAKTYFAYFLLYFILSFLVAIISSLIFVVVLKEKDKDSKKFYLVHFFFLVFIFDFILVNLKLNGWIKFDNLRAIVDNGLLVIGFVILVLLFNKFKLFKKVFANLANFVTVSLTTFLLLNYFNYGFMDWSFPPVSKLKVVVFTMIILLIPFAAIVVIYTFDIAVKRVAKLGAQQPFGGSILVMAVFLLPFFTNLQNWSAYKFSHKSVTKTVKKSSGKNYPVFLIVMDTARRDHLSCYGYERKTTPGIDELARDGVLFENFISTSPWTLPSHASLFSGMFSAKHGAHHVPGDFPYFPFSRQFDTLAEVLQQSGYRTVGVVSNAGVLNRKNNFDQGFDFYYDGTAAFYVSFWGSIFQKIFSFNEDIIRTFFQANKYKLSDEVLNIGIEYVENELKGFNEPLFIFFNLMEPHDGIFYLPDEFGKKYDFSWDKWPEFNKDEIYRFEKKLAPEKQKVLFDWYDCKLAYMDRQLKKFFDYLKRVGIYDNALIVVLADHGELFGEHNTFGHEKDLYNELIWTPLIIKYPAEMNRTGIEKKYVQTIDIMPEIFSVLNITISEEIQGQPISQINHKIISELYEKKHPLKRFQRGLKAIFSPKQETDYKLIYSTNGKQELYDFLNDPYEKADLIKEKQRIANDLTQELLSWYSKTKKSSKKQRFNSKTKQELMEKLKTLGYIK